MFEVSLWEWDFATGQSLGGSGSAGGSGGCLGGGGAGAVPYHFYRVFNAQDPFNARIEIVRDVVQAVAARRVKLCLAV